MTEPETKRPSRDEELEHIVDQLDETVADERAAAGAPGNWRDREREEAVPSGSESEPPD